jgi:hypothetical protein
LRALNGVAILAWKKSAKEEKKNRQEKIPLVEIKRGQTTIRC